MLWLIDEGYSTDDIKYLHTILNEILTHSPLCDSNCKNCKKLEMCKSLHELHFYIEKIY